MLQQLVVGSIIIVITVTVQALIIGSITVVAKRIGGWLRKPPHVWKMVIALISTVLIMVAGISICAWIWAGVFLLLGLFEQLEPAVYFTLVTMTTLGFGDITLDTQWRLLSGLTAVNGLILFGFTTAFLVEFMLRLNKAQKAP